MGDEAGLLRLLAGLEAQIEAQSEHSILGDLRREVAKRSHVPILITDVQSARQKASQAATIKAHFGRATHPWWGGRGLRQIMRLWPIRTPGCKPWSICDLARRYWRRSAWRTTPAPPPAKGSRRCALLMLARSS